MLDKYLINHCAPTLASLKTANLFSINYISDIELNNNLDLYNKQLNSKGIKLFVLKKTQSNALIYVYRQSLLENDFAQKGVFELLQSFGYESTNIDYALNKLKDRIAQSSTFPHEIGLFLSYPIDDVKGFIENDGKNCKCVGCWKVYCNECDAIKKFNCFKKCTNIYIKHWSLGKSIFDLSVSA